VKRINSRKAAAVVVMGVGLALLTLHAPEEPYSNIYASDYVGPDKCASCHEENHEENYESWRSHPHRTMTQNPNDESVKGDFSGAELRYGRGRAVFHRDGRKFLMSIYEGDRLVRRHVVTRTVGSVYVQYYAGTQTEGPEPRWHRTYRTESKLPFGYSIALKRWLPEVYLDSTVLAERKYLEEPRLDYIYGRPPTHLWNGNCLYCHNTYPYASHMLNLGPAGAQWMGGFPEDSIDWRGSAVRQGRLQIGRERFVHGSELVTVGISCESCHFGGREHAVEKREIRFVPTASELTVRRPGSERPLKSDRKDPLVVNSICRQCHSAGLAVYPDGAHAVNSSESLAMDAGACSGAIKCTDCHTPHEAGPPSGSTDLEGHVDACLGCHPQFVGAAEQAKHTRHSSSINCLDCHMPRIVSGLDTVVRSHRISSPTDPRMLGTDAPNACNLCHLDKPLDWTLRELEQGWGYSAPAQTKSAAAQHPLAPAGEAWLHSENTFLRAATAEAYARAPRVEGRIAMLLQSLLDEQAFNRTLGLIALERVLARRVSESEYDLLAPLEARRQQVSELTRALGDGAESLASRGSPGALGDPAAQ
jgi:hypothetical protein